MQIPGAMKELIGSFLANHGGQRKRIKECMVLFLIAVEFKRVSMVLLKVREDFK